VLVNAVVINSLTYGDVGDAVQAEATTFITLDDGSLGRLVHINMRDTPTQNQPQSGEYAFIVMRETSPESGDYAVTAKTKCRSCKPPLATR